MIVQFGTGESASCKSEVTLQALVTYAGQSGLMFQSTPPRGGRRAAERGTAPAEAFQSTPLREGRPGFSMIILSS